MSIPFLPASLIHPTYTLLQFPATIIPTEAIKLEKLNKYFKKRWITHVNPEELSIFDSKLRQIMELNLTTQGLGIELGLITPEYGVLRPILMK